MKAGQKLWTWDELILAINLYCNLPFGKMHRLNQDVIELASVIGRTPSAVAYKLGNLASLDPSLKARGIKGADHRGGLDDKIWKRFDHHWSDLPLEASEAYKRLSGGEVLPAERLLEFEIPEGKTREQLIKARVGQRSFRDWVLSSYNYACCITGIKQPELLIAAHIKPWSIDEKNRMNPSNGLALNALHDKAFEHGYFTITPDYIIKVSPFIRKQKNSGMDFLINFEDKKITLPSKFLPDPELLRYHNEECFKR